MTKWIVCAAVAVFAIIIVSTCVSISNKEKRLRNEFVAQEKANQANYDNLWKTISEKYQVSDEYKEAALAAIKENVQGRTGGSLFKAVTETVPGLNTDLYKDLVATIEGKRNSFEAKQTRLTDIKREHQNLIDTWPGSWIVGSRTPLEVKLVTSSRTTKAFETGEDDVIIKKK